MPSALGVGEVLLTLTLCCGKVSMLLSPISKIPGMEKAAKGLAMMCSAVTEKSSMATRPAIPDSEVNCSAKQYAPVLVGVNLTSWSSHAVMERPLICCRVKGWKSASCS